MLLYILLVMSVLVCCVYIIFEANAKQNQRLRPTIWRDPVYIRTTPEAKSQTPFDFFLHKPYKISLYS